VVGEDVAQRGAQRTRAADAVADECDGDAARIAVLKTFCDQRSFDVSYYVGIDPAAARENIYNDLPAVSFEAGEVASGGPDDAIADEARAMLTGEATPSRGAVSYPPLTLPTNHPV